LIDLLLQSSPVGFIEISGDSGRASTHDLSSSLIDPMIIAAIRYAPDCPGSSHVNTDCIILESSPVMPVSSQ
jgi:hypothetical protein